MTGGGVSEACDMFVAWASKRSVSGARLETDILQLGLSGPILAEGPVSNRYPAGIAMNLMRLSQLDVEAWGQTIPAADQFRLFDDAADR
ncbi:hypothetical protein GWI33_009954 [Rhynchophorus ferrugineus]|uniref:Uncharacterized protein n=1 Tax=Rhynchophorus ferrugineus TaxID=354439 RepID=A0A834ISK7_RHYFE|nr:hypothetical protein GWI33_009954 [Rhynchophorus ferrugineus]